MLLLQLLLQGGVHLGQVAAAAGCGGGSGRAAVAGPLLIHEDKVDLPLAVLEVGGRVVVAVGEVVLVDEVQVNAADAGTVIGEELKMMEYGVLNDISLLTILKDMSCYSCHNADRIKSA